jgi:sulfhydrogenase subunit delta
MKPRVAIFDFACCEGCQLQLVNLEESLLDLASMVDVVNWREAISDREEDYDIAIVEGSITRASDEVRIKSIRDKAAVVVAFGACANLGGVNCLKNFQGMDNVLTYVYGDKAHYFETYPARPIQAVIPVDQYIWGCPPHKKEILRVLTALLLGKKPDTPTSPVCVECKLKGNVCVFELGMHCLGPVTRGGCEAWCPSVRDGCIGCRGVVPEPNLNAEKEVLAKYGLTTQDVMDQFRIFLGYEVAGKV